MKNIVLGIGIIVVFGLALWQGIDTFYPFPEWDDYCDEFRTAQVIENQEQCEAVGGGGMTMGFLRELMLRVSLLR